MRLSERLRRTRELRAAERAAAVGSSAVAPQDDFQVVRVKSNGLGGPRSRAALRAYEAPRLDGISEEPLVSCLCVTENRHAFMPWLLWNYDRQQWKKRELVIVDSSTPPIEVPQRPDIRVVRTPLGSSLGVKRNRALDAAHGEVIAWFDDDDWQHPKRLSTLVPLLRKHAARMGASFIGPSESYFIDLQARRCDPHQMYRYAIFNGSVYYREMVSHARFDEHILRTEDTRWIATLLRDRRGAAVLPPHPSWFLWLSHEANVSNTTLLRKLQMDAQPVIRKLGWAWGDTPRQLTSLRARLSSHPAKHPARTVWVEGRPELAIPSNSAEVVVPKEEEPKRVSKAWRSERGNVEGKVEDKRGEETGTSAEGSGAGRSVAAVGKAASVASAKSAALPSWRGSVLSAKLQLSVYDLTAGPRSAASESPLRCAPALGRRAAMADLMTAVGLRCKHEWTQADYVGFVLPGCGRLDVGEVARAIERQGARAEVYVVGSGARAPLRRFLEPYPDGVRIAEHVLKRMGIRTEALERLAEPADRMWLARPEVLEHFVRSWLMPARSVLEARRDRELRRLLEKTDRNVEHANGNPEAVSGLSFRDVFFRALPALAFTHDPRSVRAVGPSRAPQGDANSGRVVRRPVVVARAH